MSDCKIVKRHDHFTISFAGGKPRSVKKWGAICPKCNEFIVGGTQYYYGYSNTNSRKTAKDALHVHIRQNHK